jgi:hypothetical protein
LAALNRRGLLIMNSASCYRRNRATNSAKSLLSQGAAPTAPLMSQPLVSCRKVRFTSRPAFRAGVNAENLRSYSFGAFGLVTSVPQGANPASLQEHFAPFSQLLTFTKERHRLTNDLIRRAGYRISGGRTGRSPCLTLSINLVSSASIDQQALKALYGTLAFVAASGLDAGRGLSSQRGLKLEGRYPFLLSRSPEPSGTLVPSIRSMVHAMRLCSHPPTHTFCNSLQPVERTYTAWSC